IPHEHDSPSDDLEQFEVQAGGPSTTIGSLTAPLLLRYRDAAWHVDLQGMRELAGRVGYVGGIAFVRPDDGWLVVNGNVSGVSGTSFVFHYDGHRWVDC